MEQRESYAIRATRAILRDIGECSCRDCILFYLREYKPCLPSMIGMHGVKLLARENCMTGAVNFNLDLVDNDEYQEHAP